MNLIKNMLKIAMAVLPLLWVDAGNSQESKSCPGLRALSGGCANIQAVQDATDLAMVMTTVRASYFGTPIGSMGGPFIPFERLFSDDMLLYGLPTYSVRSTIPINAQTTKQIIIRTK